MKMLLKSFAVACLVSCAMAQNPCAGKANGFLPDPSACENYFSCFNGIAYNATCSPSVFNKGTSTCVLKTKDSCPPCPATGIKKVQDYESCSKWTLCVDNTKLELTCKPGTLFNSANGNCDLSKNVKCNIDPCVGLTGTSTPPVPYVAFIASPESTTKYHLCIDKITKEVIECPSGLIFDPQANVCIVPLP